ncbi:hypothetical protein [Limnoglobus roseus]|uniref:Molecular chaperone DnaK n=1 Tax=Limnoglobus roseus TaxID=2598579 RepID=A0A5C1ASK7_9BACT|nr:hypothetical protein [Limnoglobus roseus]QEL19888.1 molecular chaperone DnaK [Limnoglobus roseus]
MREALGGTNLAALKRATEELEQASAAVAQHLSAATAGEKAGRPSDGPARPRSSAPDAAPADVIDAEYEVKG